jgi:hypothetical protein
MSHRTRALDLDSLTAVLRLYAVALEDHGPTGEITPGG